MTRPRRIHPSCIAALLIGSLACAPRALAQATVDSKAAAEALFDDGLALMRKGDFAAACVKLEQSQSIDHGIGTMLYLAECYEKSGRTASAWAMFRQAASEAAASGESQRAEAGRQRAEKLTPTLSKLTVTVTAPVPAGLELTRNGAAVSNALWGTAVPVDPGDQRVEARAPGYLPWSGTVRIGASADSQTLTVPALTPQPVNELPVAQQAPAAEPLAPAAPVAAPAASTTTTTTAAPSSGSSQRIVGIVIGAVGVVGLGVGSVFGLKAMSKNDDAKKHCEDTSCDPQGVSLTKDAQSAARLANVFVIGGAVLAAAGIVTYLMAPSDSEPPPVAVSADAHAVRATVGGVF